MNKYMVFFVKRVFDFTLALTLLLVSSPLWLVSAMLLAVTNRGKVFFIQQRPGKDERPFYIIKLKTMNDKKDNHGNLLPDAKRLHLIGKLIRKTSIDELPQFFNVLKGDMSLVGPRPLLMEYLPLYNKEQKKRHNVKPGITGWAQVNGRNAISWEEKFKYDVWYVENQSLKLYVKVLWLTLIKVFKFAGISQQGQTTVEYFNGKN